MSKLPPLPILQGLYYGACLRQPDIAVWYGVTRQAVSWALVNGRRGWEDEARGGIGARRARAIRPYSLDGDGVTWLFSDDAPVSLPPQEVLDTWGRKGWNARQIAEAGEEFAR